jgi:cupin 2 domain-containing protein
MEAIDCAMDNIFDEVKTRAAEEEITALLSRPGLRIERIVSTGQASPPDFWYDQPNDEWVIVLTGSAGLAVEGEAERRLEPGDIAFLPRPQAPPRRLDGRGRPDRLARRPFRRGRRPAVNGGDQGAP